VSIIAVFNSKGTTINSNGIALKITSWFLTFEQLTSLLSDELAQPWCAATPIAALGP
jgi:hypothetical protein